MNVAVVAHTGKSTGGGLTQLEAELRDAGVRSPLWFEVPKSKKAPKAARRAVEEGADLVIIWGGDGTVQRVADQLVGSTTTLAIVPAGTANLLATNLGVPSDIPGAVRTALAGPRRQLDLGVVNGEHFAVMSGVGFDARMIHDADADLKDRIGRAAYVVSGRRHLRSERFTAKVRLDGGKWFKGRASCILCGNVGKIFGGITVFDDAVPDDSRLDFGIVTAKSTWEWTRALGRTALGHARHSPFVEVAQAQCAEVRLDQPVQLEIDGGSRPPTDRLRIEVRPRALTVCVPAERMP